jgi:hypothetical protein
MLGGLGLAHAKDLIEDAGTGLGLLWMSLRRDGSQKRLHHGQGVIRREARSTLELRGGPR